MLHMVVFSSVAQLCATLWDPMDRIMPGFLVHYQIYILLKLMSIKSVMPSNHLILCRPLLLLSSIFPSIFVFSNESILCIRWPKYWSFSFSISPSNEFSGLIAFQFSSVQSLSRVQLSTTPWITAHQASLSITNSWSLHKLMSIKSVMPSSHLILCRPLHLLPPIPPSISLFQWVNYSHEVAKVSEFQLQHQSFQWTLRTDLL